jgi:hypothetical protein
MAARHIASARRYNAVTAVETMLGCRFPSSLRVIIELGAETADVIDPRTGQVWTVAA